MVIVYGIVQRYGINGLTIATLMAGVMLVVMGFARLGSINIYSSLIAVGSLLIIVFWQRFVHKIPGSLIALIMSTLVVQAFNLPVETIGSRFGEIPSMLPAPSIPAVDFATLKALIQPATTIALLAAIESPLSAVIADGMTGGKHRSNMELVAQSNLFYEIGEENIFGNIDDALNRARGILGLPGIERPGSFVPTVAREMEKEQEKS